MSAESSETRLDEIIDEIKTRLENLEGVLGDEFDQGREKFADRTADLRERVEGLRGEESEEELEPTRVEQLKETFEELSEVIDEEVEESRARISSILEEVGEQFRELEQRGRGR